MVLWCYNKRVSNGATRGGKVAYFLKKTKNKKGTYLQIYESFYDPLRGHTAHRSLRAIGYEHELKASGITDPITHFRAEVDSMNAQRRAGHEDARVRKIGESTPERFLGHFPLKALDSVLGVQKDMDFLQMAGGFRFSLAELLSSLIYARAVAPCSKSKTFHDVLPRLAESPSFSLDQLYDGLAFLGQEYEKVVEIYNHRIAKLWPRDTSTTYFDCTNFYFEIDREDDLRRKGPSKENRHDPIVGLGLLLDGQQIPIGMKVFPGNESEKPVMRQVIDSLKRRSEAAGRTVRVADKGLNCADNIAGALLDGDGYIFSKSVKQLPEVERVWALSEQGWRDVVDSEGRIAYRLKSCTAEFSYSVTTKHNRKKKVDIEEKRVVTYNPKLARKQLSEINRQVEKARGLRLAAAKRSEYGDSAKYVTFSAVDDNGEEPNAQVVALLNHKAIDKAKSVAGYNMLVTSEKHMSDEDIYSTYHNLWRIEESFKVMKSQLDARPIYLQKPETITGHFLICYIAVLLIRLLQVKILNDQFSSEDIMGFIKGFRAVAVSDQKFINISKSSPLIDKLEQMTGLSLNNYYLTKRHVQDILSYKLI